MAWAAAICHSPLMQRRRSTAAGGIFIFVGLLAGAVYGIDRGEPMLWMLRGFGAGILLAILVWLIDRWRG
jgi:hypothetical protein